MAVERSRHPVMELVRDQAGGRDLAEPSFHRAQPQVADLLLFVRAVSDPTVVFEADHEEAVIVGVDRHAVDASRACWTANAMCAFTDSCGTVRAYSRRKWPMSGPPS